MSNQNTGFFILMAAVGLFFLWHYIDTKIDKAMKRQASLLSEEVKSLLDRQMPVNEVEVNLSIKQMRDGVVVSREVNINCDELTSAQVEHWLEARGLIMQPKGVDFKVKPPAAGVKH